MMSKKASSDLDVLEFIKILILFVVGFFIIASLLNITGIIEIPSLCPDCVCECSKDVLRLGE